MEWGVRVHSMHGHVTFYYVPLYNTTLMYVNILNIITIPNIPTIIIIASATMAYIHIAGIDIVTLAVLMTLQWPQHYTIVIICVGGAHHATHTTEATLLHLHTQTLTMRFFCQLSALVAMVIDLSLPS